MHRAQTGGDSLVTFISEVDQGENSLFFSSRSDWKWDAEAVQFSMRLSMLKKGTLLQNSGFFVKSYDYAHIDSPRILFCRKTSHWQLIILLCTLEVLPGTCIESCCRWITFTLSSKLATKFIFALDCFLDFLKLRPLESTWSRQLPRRVPFIAKYTGRYALGIYEVSSTLRVSLALDSARGCLTSREQTPALPPQSGRSNALCWTSSGLWALGCIQRKDYFQVYI